jgi:hypothetical protein
MDGLLDSVIAVPLLSCSVLRNYSQLHSAAQVVSVVLSGNQVPSVFISGNQVPSVVISGSQVPSVVISGNQVPSVVISVRICVFVNLRACVCARVRTVSNFYSTLIISTLHHVTFTTISKMCCSNTHYTLPHLLYLPPSGQRAARTYLLPRALQGSHRHVIGM